MSIFYNPLNEGFYHTGVQPQIPNTAVKITKLQYQEFQKAQAEGFKPIFLDGGFTFQERVTTEEELSIVEASFIDDELIRVRSELEKIQDSDTNAVGTVAQWREYRKALRAWPEHEKFPSKEFRPVAPGV